MRILFVSKNLIAGSLAYRLTQEGHDVKLWIGDKSGKENFDNLVKKTRNWKKELDWVGKTGLIIFDDTGFGKAQDRLRKKGYTVFGGSYLAERLETEREFGQKVLEECGIKSIITKDFAHTLEATEYAIDNKNKWVIKQNNGKKVLTYIGQFDDGKDVISVLKNYLTNKKINKESITLQQRIDGIEIGVGRYFNGKHWVGPIEYNIEHCKFLHGDLGPITSEMGTLAWFDNNEDNKLYAETIKKMKDFLVKADFRGDFELNCIVNETGIYPLEITARFGSPITHLHDELIESPWGEFLYAVASGKSYDVKFKKDYGVVVLLATPPFPYSKRIHDNHSYGIHIYFDGMKDEDFKHIHLEEVAKMPDNHDWYISDRQGYICYVTGHGETVEEARKKVYDLVGKIVIPKMMYRDDIGMSFLNGNKEKLIKWGYLTS